MELVAPFMHAVRHACDALLQRVYYPPFSGSNGASVNAAAGSRSLRFCRGAALVWFASHVLMKFRLLPDPCLRALFAAYLAGGMVASDVIIRMLKVLRCIGIVPTSVFPGLCAVTMTVCLKWSKFASPHIAIHVMEGSLPSFSHMQTPNAVLVNHASFMDTVVFLWMVNATYMYRMKTFYKAQLNKVPLLGYVIQSAEMLPVYFVSDEGSEFRVEKDKQAVVLERSEAHLLGGGSICFFPEGAMNRVDLRTLQPFRLGSFKMILDHKLHVYYMLTIGTDKVWRVKEPLGGHAADVYVYYGKIDVDYSDKSLDAQTLANYCRAHMQARLDFMHVQIATGQA
jgi:1-acyl-sn-glycerol-3-phosphate acyltransferase